MQQFGIVGVIGTAKEPCRWKNVLLTTYLTICRSVYLGSYRRLQLLGVHVVCAYVCRCVCTVASGTDSTECLCDSQVVISIMNSHRNARCSL